MNLTSKLLALALVVSSAGLVRAQDGLGPLQGKTEKLAQEAGSAVVGFGPRRGGNRNPAFDVLDPAGSGAGFVIDAEGRILTAAPLVPASGRVDVYFKGHHRAAAKVVARDTRTATALLKLEDPAAVAKKLGVDKLPCLKLGKSGELKLGRVVATVGNPFNTIQADGVPAFSLGVVSALGRVRDADNYKGQAIETDAAINPGSYGGPLLDVDGKVVGLVIEPYSTKRWLGIAVPIDEIAPILDDLKAGRAPAPPHLGLSVAGNGEASLEGIKISDIEEGGPAAKAGLHPGDVLQTFDGAKVVESYDIERELGLLSQGTPVELGVVRDGRKLSIKLTLGASKVSEPVANTTEAPPTANATNADGKPYLGITVEEKGDGLYIKTVVEDGPAGKSKLSPGVKVVQFNGKDVTKKQEIVDAISKLSPGDKVTLKVENSEGFHKTVTITLGTKEAPKTEEGPKTEEKPKKRGPAFFGVAPGKPEDEEAKGLVVTQVKEGSAADKAGLKVGDFLLEIDGKKLEEPQDFLDTIRSHKAGDKLKVKYSRDGGEKTVTVTLGERPADLDDPHARPSDDEEKDEKKDEKAAPKRPWVGFALAEKNGKIVVDEVAKDSPADAAKIKAGLTVLAADGDEKLTIDKLDQIIGSKKIGDKLVLKLENEEGFTKTVTVTLGEKPKDK